MRIIRNKVLFALVLLMRATPWLGFVAHTPDPSLPGRPVSLADSTDPAIRAAVGLLVAALLVCVWLPQRRLSSWALQLAASLALLPLLLFAAGQAALHLAAGAPPAARTLPGAGFWWISSLAALAAADALRHLRAPRAAWLGAAALVAGTCLVLAWAGALHALRLG
jgi:osmoprotectant transport system permease protein